MSNNFTNDNRNLSDVFKELQEKRAEYEQININHQNSKKDGLFSGVTEYISSNKKNHFNYSYSSQYIKKPKKIKKSSSIKTFSLSKLLIILILISIVTSLTLLSLSFSFTTYGKEDTQETASTITNFEGNEKVLNLTQIISTNIDNGTIKETINEQRDVPFSTKYQSSDTLPKGEEAVVQQGTNGKNQVIAVRTYENNVMLDENIIQTTTIIEPVQQIVNIGTSEFLSKYQVHIGDIMYVISDTNLKSKASDTSDTIVQIPATLDVKLMELAGDWCKVSYDDKQGYVPASSLTSATAAPEIVGKARFQRIIRDVNIDMPLNKKSGLAASDFKKMLSGNSSDTNKIFENNATAFFDVEQKYNINGVFLAALAIHESGWGTSQIATDKKNLFGYGAYDSDPYNGSFTFTQYSEGIEMVAKALVKYYINPAGTVIYDNDTATATYYNGSTLTAVNTRYSTDTEWHTKVFNYMNTLYNKLK